MSRASNGNRVSSLVVKTRVPKSKNRRIALTASNAVSGRSGARPLAPALIGQVVVAPGVEHEQGPENLAMIPLAADVLGDEARHRRWLEETAPCDPRRGEAVLEERPEGSSQPEGVRYAEALLAARHDLGRKQVTDRALEQMLRRHAADLEVRRYPACELDKSMIEEWRSHLEPRGHRRAVGGHQGLVGEIEACVVVDHALDGVGRRRLADRQDQLRVRIEAAERALHARGQKTRLLGRREPAEQELRSHFGLVRQGAHELLEQEIEAPVAR